MTFKVFKTVAAAISLPPSKNEDWVIRRSAVSLAGSKHIFDAPAEANAFVGELFRLSVSAIAIDTEYRYQSPGVPLRGGGTFPPVSL
jgi:formiminotetrahydrofolate cyclodeaminase